MCKGHEQQYHKRKYINSKEEHDKQSFTKLATEKQEIKNTIKY